MLQYIINATAIWLVSLLLFDLFLRRESYHNYNRSYLIVTFLLGAFIPLWQWQENNAVKHTALPHPVEQLITAKEQIVTGTVPATDIDMGLWITIIYLAGVLISVGLLLFEIIKLAEFYRGGTRVKMNGWTVIQTYRDHAPFSFLRTLFVGDRRLYSAEEWDMLIAHEQRHRTLFHFGDLVLMQVSRIIFWFHPLMYIYNKRLLLVHEYQADIASARQPQAYGRFLIEQAVLQAAPALTHSFNRSHIKKRIVMLNRRSSALAGTKRFVFIPLVLLCVVCFSKNSFSQKFIKNGNYVTYKGNRFELSKPSTDTQLLTDPVSGETLVKYIAHDAVPIKMNGQLIPQGTDKAPYFTGNYKNLRAYLLKGLKNELSKLGDGQYTLNVSSVLVGTKGQVVYFNYADMRRGKTAGDTNPSHYQEIDKTLQENIFRKVCELMDNAPVYIPATLDGKNVVAPATDDYFFWNQFKVKDHKVYDQNKNHEFEEL